MRGTLAPIERMIDAATGHVPGSVRPKPTHAEITKRFTAVCDAAMRWHRRPTERNAAKLHAACDAWLEIGGW